MHDLDLIKKEKKLIKKQKLKSRDVKMSVFFASAQNRFLCLLPTITTFES